MAKYGSILENLNFLRMGKKVFVFVIFGIIRRQLLILTTVFMHDNIVMSIISMIF